MHIRSPASFPSPPEPRPAPAGSVEGCSRAALRPNLPSSNRHADIALRVDTAEQRERACSRSKAMSFGQTLVGVSVCLAAPGCTRREVEASAFEKSRVSFLQPMKPAASKGVVALNQVRCTASDLLLRIAYKLSLPDFSALGFPQL